MKIQAALCAGQRVRHRAWPLHQFAELRSTSLGELKLHKVTPDGDATPLDLNVSVLTARDGWLLVEGKRHQ